MSDDVRGKSFPKNACPDILKKYGLWIFRYGEANKSPSHMPIRIFRYYNFYCISHLIKGRGWFCLENTNPQIFETGHGVIVSPGLRQGYGGYKSEYLEDMVCFLGPVADQLKSAGIIRNGVFHIGLTRRLFPIIQLTRIPTISSQLKANMLLQQLLLDLYLEHDKKNNEDKSSDRIRLVLDEIQANPQKWWLVSDMAELANLSLAQFRRLFQKHTGLSPKAYVMQLKMKSASEELVKNEKSIHAIASEHGFNDPYHFSNFFKKLTGCSPIEFKKR